ncbi:BON domain-containing protein [Ramlibacter sp.]|jgi:osmotically-inducible protein OsmY|uniref:BON domain-containing protein n=1 Tax=Ramlibacter sp. TaxID=1917967 RepID=UPI002FC73E8D|nr:transport-associated protein [Ramlibacter sp.]MCE3273744.1 transport-associated protein [Ramlibacter sp.]
MKSDIQIKSDVNAEFLWDPEVNAASVGVAVKDGIVTLSGTTDTYAQKHAVERAARRVSGVRGIAVDLEVRLTPGHARTDAEIAQAAVHALRWHSLVPEDKVKVEVENGWVTLSGEVDWAYQSASAEQAVRSLIGVKGVGNQIHLKQRADPSEIRAGVSAAFARHARRQASHVTVDVDGGVVTLGGTVDSLAEHDAAIGTAYAARGVSRVIDHIEVQA